MGRSGGGLSPPTRGNHDAALEAAGDWRSIPAHAGEPASADTTASATTVYPRPRGGTQVGQLVLRRNLGLSPPTRGNPPDPDDASGWIGSIPAHAGEPHAPATAPDRHRVYPRPRGGTLNDLAAHESQIGLSPPTRGNRRRARHVGIHAGSIPAHAGEPSVIGARGITAKVYPRPRGGTHRRQTPLAAGRGLSPPTRGNRLSPRRKSPPARSIPAHAGEPPPKGDEYPVARVYPRPRGGTDARGADSPRQRGLSPPTRGNPLSFAFSIVTARSIPAHAGEPGWRRVSRPLVGVYPRPRGGTRERDVVHVRG